MLDPTPTQRPYLMHITRNYPPLWGGMERLNWRMVQELVRRYYRNDQPMARAT